MKKNKEEQKNNPFKEKENNEIIENKEEKENIEEIEKNTEENIEEKLKKEIEDLNNKYLRLAADFDNYRKRQDAEKEAMIKYAASDTLIKLIGVLDTLDKALEAVEKYDDPKTIKESYNVAVKQFKDTLQKCGLEKINTEGEKFDPNFHEAVSQTPTSEVEEGTIIMEMRSGYKLKDKVLRPSMVSVAVSEG